MSEGEKINSIEGYKKSINTSALNLNLQNDNSKNIITLYGATYLDSQKDIFSSLDTENSSIRSKISILQNEQTNITNVNNEKKEQLEDLKSLLGSVDTEFINNNKLSSIISASSAHTETLKIYSGARIDKLIRDAIAEGKFEVEVFELTDIEAKILLDNGYFIKETTEPKKSGNRVIQVSSWTINWESANSTSTKIEPPIEIEPPYAAPKEPLP